MFEKLFSAIFEKVIKDSAHSSTARRAEIYVQRAWIGKENACEQKAEFLKGFSRNAKSASAVLPREDLNAGSVGEEFASGVSLCDRVCDGGRESRFMQDGISGEHRLNRYNNARECARTRVNGEYARESVNFARRAPFSDMQEKSDISVFFEGLSGLNVKERALAARE